MKTTKRENKSGTVRYLHLHLHLAHNEWDPVKGRAVPKVLFTFSREDDLDRDAVKPPSEAHRRARLVADKLAGRPNAPRDHRSYPRGVKRRTTQFRTKQPTDQGIHRPAPNNAVAIRVRAP